MRMPSDLLIPVPPLDQQEDRTAHFAETVKRTLFDAFQVADSFLDGARIRQKHGYDK